MTQHTKATHANKSVLRTRAAVLAVGLGGSLALGTGVALAATPQSDVFAEASAGSLEKSIQTQAKAQAEAAHKDKKQDEKHGKKKAAKKADKRYKGHGKAKRADRSQRTPLNAASWIAPVGDAPLSAPFAAGGDRWAHGHSGQDFASPSAPRSRPCTAAP